VLCFSTFVWQLTWAVLFQTSDPQLSNMLVRIGYLLILFLPTSLYQLLVEVSQATNERKYVYISYGFSLLLAVALMTTDLIVSGYYEYYWGHYPQAGLLHPAHVLQTAIVIIRGLFIISKKQQTVSEPSRSVLGYCKISVLVYFFAAADYLCNYGIEFYPPGIVFIATSLTIIAYTIRYKPNQIINSLIHRLYTTLDKRDIIYQVSEALVGMMAIRDAQLFFQDKTEFQQFNQTSHQWLRNDGSRPLMRFLSEQQDQVFFARDIVTQVGELKTLLPPSGIVLTLRSPQKLEGILVFDKRYSEIPYTHKDVRFLDTVARQLSVFFDRANAHEQRISEAIAKENERQKNNILKSLAASIAHEMRNPLAQISGNLYLIEELQKQVPYQYGAKPIVAHHIDNAKRVIKNGLQVIDITIDAIKDRPVNTENFQMIWARALVEEAVEDYAYEEPEHAEQVSVKGDDFALMAEPVMVKYVLYNLLQNALWQIKTLPDTKIIISLKVSDSGLNQIEVRDTGSGIAAEAIPKLFDSFYTSGKQGDTGLGLAYCKRTMVALGGDISCESEVDQYTAFTLLFPEV
jgi:signal transduction histidine kinase